VSCFSKSAVCAACFLIVNICAHDCHMSRHGPLSESTAKALRTAHLDAEKDGGWMQDEMQRLREQVLDSKRKFLANVFCLHTHCVPCSFFLRSTGATEIDAALSWKPRAGHPCRSACAAGV